MGFQGHHDKSQSPVPSPNYVYHEQFLLGKPHNILAMDKGVPGVLKEFWAQIILQCILPPALHKVTTTSRTSNDVDCILADLQCHYADLHVAISTLAQCHVALGPIPDPVLYKESELPLLRSHSQILAGSAALMDYSDTPGVTVSLYS